MKRRLPASVDLTLLEFLEYGDMTIIAAELTNERAQKGITAKVYPQYVWKICKGHHRNPRILQRAFKIALERRASFPKQVII